jgi:xanthine dehydrogenase iron-sulfur cluster and FAD-binding subunit A
MNIRLAIPDDAEKILAWSEANKERSHFDAQTLAYPLTEVICAENGKTQLYMPVQLAAVLEAMAPNPEATEMEKAKALYLSIYAIFEQVRKQGVREIYFIGTDPQVVKLAERVGFEEVPWPVYRKKL